MNKLDLESFVEYLDLLGPDLSCWPQTQRAAAQLLLADSEDARTQLAQAQRLDELLHCLPRVDAPPGLREQIRASVARADIWQRVSEWFTGPLWRPALVAVFPLVVGFVFGLNNTQPGDDDLAQELSLMAFTTSFEEYPYEP
jgi:hypothetical protein